ncbi:CBS domain-containing protein [Caldisphaera lagunensis]|uniref:CBS domain-containing protein n=1 Tax=Caldisphaera lagunensis TaxID=200415 RepID=UPI0006622430|nr:CBS domain-containing protein [Caldisphaera lagunensis]
MYEIGNTKVISIIDRTRPIAYNDDSIATLRKIIRNTGARALPILDRNSGNFLGVINRSDVLIVSSTKTNATSSSILKEHLLEINSNYTIFETLNLMFKYDLWEIPILEGKKYIGLVSISDIVKLLFNKAKDYLKNINAENYMTKEPITVNLEDPISKIWKKMMEYKYAGFPVVNDKEKLTGIITQLDLIKKGYTRIHLESESGVKNQTKVKDAMTYTVIYGYPWSTLYEISIPIVKKDYGRIPIVSSENDKKVVGIIDREDIAKVIIKGDQI